MKNILFLSNFNNYYNRHIKTVDTLEEYFTDNDYILKECVNFTPGDGVTSQITTNWDLDWLADYMVVLNDANEVVSRWFVLSAVRTLNNQYTLNVRRDVIVDFYKEVIEAPVFVQKANLLSANPLIYNSEALTYNQIKKSEILLKDVSKIPWIVGYVQKGHTPQKVEYIPVRGEEVINIGTLPFELEDTNDPSKGGKFTVADPLQIKMLVRQYWPFGQARYNMVQSYNYTNQQILGGSIEQIFTSKPEALTSGPISPRATRIEAREYWSFVWSLWLNTKKNDLLLGLESLFDGEGLSYLTQQEQQEILNLNGKVVYSSIVDKYYKLNIGTSSPIPILKTIDISSVKINHVSLHSLFSNIRNIAVSNSKPEWNARAGVAAAGFEISYSYRNTNIILQEVPRGDEMVIDTQVGHNVLLDAPYDMFALPFTPDNLTLATMWGKQLGSELYDLQILPYCPARHMLDENGVNLTLGTLDKDYTPIVQDSDTVSYVLWPLQSSEKFTIQQDIPAPLTPEEIKVVNECEFVRLNSPNYNGSFDFNVAKNEGVDYFNVSFTYRPFSPYIQVAPNFKGLYGSDFGDTRGLICNGDFSVATISEAWTEYQIQNKNFQNIFDTQISTMDHQHRLSMISSGVSSGLQAAGIGMGAGFLTNKGIGAVAGAASAAGGIVDLAVGNSIYQKNKQGQIDIFNFNLGNIQARPDTLKKVSSYNINNKYFPFLEFFSATDEEKEVLKKKIEFEGMTVMSIGKISDFLEVRPGFNFFKGQLLQGTNIASNFRIVDAISVELEKGVYI
jgi:hypothetical protein